MLRFYSYGLFVVLLGFAITYQFIEPAPPSNLIIAAGSRGGAYLEFALKYQELLAQDGVTLEVLETAGSIENLALLADGKADIALVTERNCRGQRLPTVTRNWQPLFRLIVIST
ncbi:hypothetical protein KAI46_04045 [bacterium]|nr:hypothetical protein [bacterium]